MSCRPTNCAAGQRFLGTGHTDEREVLEPSAWLPEPAVLEMVIETSTRAVDERLTKLGKTDP